MVFANVFYAQGTTSHTFKKTSTQKILNTVELVEDTEWPISEITSASISPNGKLLLITDGRSGDAFVYSLSNGKLVKTLKTESAFTDTLADKGKWPVPGFIYLPHNVSPPAFGKNRVLSSLFINDSEIVSAGTLYATLQGKDTNAKKNTAGHSAIFQYNLNTNSIQVSPFDWLKVEKAPQSECLAFDKTSGSLLVNTNIHHNGSLSRGHLDSTMCLSAFTNDGKFIKDIPVSLPNECLKYSLSASQMNPKLTLSPNREIIIGYEIVPRIYNLTNRHSFDLSHLSATNDSFYYAFNEFVNTHPRGTRIPWDSLYLKRPYWLLNFSVNEQNSYYVTSIIRTSTKPWRIEFIEQKYSPTGEYITGSTFKSDEHSEFKYVFYSTEINKIVCVALKDKKNWTVSFADFQ